jgi:hypothetical protein
MATTLGSFAGEDGGRVVSAGPDRLLVRGAGALRHPPVAWLSTLATGLDLVDSLALGGGQAAAFTLSALTTTRFFMATP